MTSPVLLLHEPRAINDQNWTSAQKEILWCWKRDEGRRRRTIFFSGTLERVSAHIFQLHSFSFFYEHRAETAAIEYLFSAFSRMGREDQFITPPSLRRGGDGYSKLVIVSRYSDDSAHQVLVRLRRQRPRLHIPQGSFPIPVQDTIDVQALAPLVIYAGSGLSYESGVPTLAKIHHDFGVDDLDTQRLLFGIEDPIPGRLARNSGLTLSSFARFHLIAAAALPSASHCRIARLFERGLISTILTDNVDNIFAKCGLPFTRTRTVFPEHFEHRFAADDKTLLVIGVAADRRQIIAQARRHGMQIVVVNPCHPVSPRAQNLSYLRRQDVWYKCSAREFFTRYCARLDSERVETGVAQ